MTKHELNTAVTAAKTETKDALQTVFDALNHGQQTKILKNEQVQFLFDLYGVDYGE